MGDSHFVKKLILIGNLFCSTEEALLIGSMRYQESSNFVSSVSSRRMDSLYALVV